MAKIRLLISPALKRVFEHFPEHKNVIHTLFKESMNFKEICQDYHKCWEAILHWQGQNTDEAFHLTVEYREILRGLELEIKRYVHDYNKWTDVVVEL